MTGTRPSRLSLAQTENALNRLRKLLPSLNFKTIQISSPGDRDKITDIRETPPDFFTRDLDDTITAGEIDCAVHSAKDMPEQLREGLDFFRLPWREDPRDAVILPQSDGEIPRKPRIGISSARREEYCRQRFPEGNILSIRGDIEQRIAQLDEGKYDLLIMAAAGLNRINLSHRITEFIPLEELTPPEGQGYLAVTFRKGDRIFNLIRKLFVKPVIFAGAGSGSANNATVAVVNALKSCDVCLYDALCPAELLEYTPQTAERLFAGKRKGAHSHSQEEICTLIAAYARKGKSVVRLKGGDPGIFGRLAEELSIMDDLEFPFKVLPGVTSLSAATTSTGLLLTRRGLSRGFTVATPRKSGTGDIEWFSEDERKSFPQVYFMGATDINEISVALKKDGCPGSLPVAVVYNAGSPSPIIACGTLDDIAENPTVKNNSCPGIIIAGKNADSRFLYSSYGALGGMKILFTGSRRLFGEAAQSIEMFGAEAIFLPMIELSLAPDAQSHLEYILNVDWLIVPSPSCAVLLIELMEKTSTDIRKLPQIAICGLGTAAVFSEKHIYPAICTEENFGTEGLIVALKKRLKAGERMIKLCSDKALSRATNKMRDAFPALEEFHFYNNSPLNYSTLPDFDAALFTSPSGVDAFIKSFTIEALRGKAAMSIGEPTFKSLGNKNEHFNPLISSEATVSSMVSTLASWKINCKILEILN